MKTKPTTVLLAIVAALLAANLVINLPPQEAKAQTHLKAPHLVDVAIVTSGSDVIVRIWSGGFADYKVAAQAPDTGPQVWTPLPFNPDAPPLSRPIAAASGSTKYLSRLWADGTVDRIGFNYSSPDSFIHPTPAGWAIEPD